MRLGNFLLPRADYYSPQIIFNTVAAILAVGQPFLSYNTSHGFPILRSDNSSRLLHFPGLIVLAGSKSREMLVLAGDFLSCKLLFRVLYLPGKENGPRPDTKLLLGALIKA